MENEKRLIPFGDKVTLYDLPFGAMFAFGDDCIAVKSEYTASNGLIEAFIIDSGEQFWGGAKTAKEQNELMVQPLELVDVDAVEVVHGRWEDKYEIKSFKHTNIPVVQCSVCECYFCDIINNHHYMYHYCPNCGAKMDGDRNGTA